MKKVTDRLVVIAPEWPGNNSGYQIALKSSLLQYQNNYKKIRYIGLTLNKGTHSLTEFPLVDFYHIKVKESSLLARFARSLFSVHPAVTRKFISKKIRAQILDYFKINQIENKNWEIILEDLPIAIQIGHLIKCGFRVSVRSHNVLGEAFEGLTTIGPIYRRLAWQLEVTKCQHFERVILSLANGFYAISDRDRMQYLSRYGQKIDGLIGICFSPTDIERSFKQRHVCPIHVILHLGSLDVRKTQGINVFIDKVWPKLKENHQELVLLLGGRNSEQRDNPELGIRGLGIVGNEQEFMGRGTIFINTQEVGTGINLKSLTAMKYGKILISTRKGLEGIEGESGKHFLLANSTRELGELISYVLRNYKSVSNISFNSHKFILENYTCISNQ